MGYAKNPGSFRDTVGVLVVLAITAELLLFVVTLWAGTPELFREFNLIFWNGVKEFFLQGTGFVLAAGGLFLFLILRCWKGDPHEE